MVQSSGERASVSNNSELPERGDDTTNTGRSIDGGAGRGAGARAGSVTTATATGTASLIGPNTRSSLRTDGRTSCCSTAPTTSISLGSFTPANSRSTTSAHCVRSCSYTGMPSANSPKRAHDSRHARRNGSMTLRKRADIAGSVPSRSPAIWLTVTSNSHGVMTVDALITSVTSAGIGPSGATNSSSRSGRSMSSHNPALPTVSTTRWTRLVPAGFRTPWRFQVSNTHTSPAAMCRDCPLQRNSTSGVVSTGTCTRMWSRQ